MKDFFSILNDYRLVTGLMILGFLFSLHTVCDMVIKIVKLHHKHSNCKSKI
jgi:hypothetical protein